MITRNGVCYDLSISPYKLEVGSNIYVFSSKPHLNKFKERHKKHRETVNTSLSKRFGIEVEVSVLSDIVLYKKIETRGFLVFNASGDELCLNNIKCDGQRLMIRS